MNKPLKDWTLGEIKAECKKHKDKHTGCVFWDDGGAVSYCQLEKRLDKTYPQAWDLSEPPRWTNAEIENAKAIRRLFKEAKTIERYSQFDNTETIKISSMQSPIFYNLDKNLFPSAKRHVTYYIDEIIKEGEY